MAERVTNFSPGPSTLPLSVLQRAQRDLVSLPDVGASPLEVSHRSAWFSSVIREAEENLRTLLAVPDGYHVVFCQGGATTQFAMSAMNLSGSAPADFVLTGAWGERAAQEAVKVSAARVAWTGRDEGFVRTPSNPELRRELSRAAAYVHVTTNETIQGVEYPDTPEVPEGVPLVADASSDFLSRPVNVGAYGLLYAGAQKNAGSAGVTVVLLRDDLLSHIPDGLPTMLDYRTYVEHGILYNTPPVFAIYVLMLVTRWLRDEIGGLETMAAINREKAAMLYEVLDEDPGFYRGHADRGSRSLMNVTFRLPTAEMESAFLAQAAERGMIELEGHRSVGGIRASIYNAMARESVETLAEFMRRFRARTPA